MERNSSDDEDDRQHLVGQNDTRDDDHRSHRREDWLPTTTTDMAATAGGSPRSAFQVEDIASRIRRRWKISVDKRFLFLAVSLSLVVVIVSLSTDVRGFFSANVPGLKMDPLSNRVKESELRALYLLRQQELALVSLWNRTSVDRSLNQTANKNTSIAVGSSGFGSSVLFEDVKSAVARQISLNKEIQEALLSPHRTGNYSDGSAGADGMTGYYYYDRCRKVDQKLSGRRTIEWKPRPDKFLFAICLSGQMSNHLICLEKHMFFAALLDRVLVIPSPKFDYQYDRVIDIEHINTCLGRKVVITFDEFVEEKKKKRHVHIDRFVCYFSSPQPCYVDEEHIKKLKGIGISIGGKLESPWTEDIKKPTKRTIQDVEDKFKSDDDVIAIGDVYFADVEQDWAMQPAGPINHKCKTLVEPSRLILLTAQRFVQTFLGKNFIAIHFRRHGFLKFCNAKTPSCFYPIPQAADCITRIVERANAPVIYLSTDAAESETTLLQSLVVVDGKIVPLVKRPPRNSAEKWDALLYRHGLHDDSQVEAMLDKTISAMSSVFIGAAGSTFTEDILRLRKDWGTSSLCDEYICQGEGPNFIADDE